MGLFFTVIVVCVALIVAMHVLDGIFLVLFDVTKRKWYHRLLAELQSIDYEVPLIIAWGILISWFLLFGAAILCIRADDTDKLYEAKIVYEQYQETGRQAAGVSSINYIEREKVRRFANDHPFLSTHNKKAVAEALEIWTELKSVKDH